MISHDYKFIYSHLPKCGGTTVETMLKKYASSSIGNPVAIRNKWWRNKNLFDLYENFPNYYKFTFSRNPYSRIVSAYTHWENKNEKVRGNNFRHFTEQICSFLSESPERIYATVGGNRCKNKTVDSKDFKFPYNDSLLGYHVLPQRYFITEDFDFIGKIENFQTDFDLICERLGIPT